MNDTTCTVVNIDDDLSNSPTLENGVVPYVADSSTEQQSFASNEVEEVSERYDQTSTTINEASESIAHDQDHEVDDRLTSPAIDNSCVPLDVRLAGYPNGLLPNRIHETVLQAPDKLSEMLEKTVKSKIQLVTCYINSEECRLPIKTCDLTFPESYACKLINDRSLIETIIGPLCQKILNIQYLILPELSVQTLQYLIIEKQLFRGINQSDTIEIPFTATTALEIEETLPPIITTLITDLKPSFIECKPNQTASTQIDIKKVNKLKKLLKSTVPVSISLKYNGSTIQKGEKNSESRKRSGSSHGGTSKKTKTKENTSQSSKANKLLKFNPVPMVNNPLYTFDCFQPHIDVVDQSFTAYTYWQLDKVHIKQITGLGTTIAIIDSGIDSSHPAFPKGQIIHFEDFAKNELNPVGVSHGTLCAGIACGNKFQYLKSTAETCYADPGVAPDCKLIICKTMCCGEETAQWESVLKALEWIIQMEIHIDVVSMSLGSLWFQPEIADAITDLVRKKIIVVCAASNSGYKYSQPISYPARLGHVLCIGSHGVHGKPSPFSPVGQEIDFLAPGEMVTGPSSEVYNHSVITNSGTSFATPAVAGLICLILSYIKSYVNKKYLYSLSNPWVIKEILREISTSPGRHSDDMGFGALCPLQFFNQPERALHSIWNRLQLTEVVSCETDSAMDHS